MTAMNASSGPSDTVPAPTREDQHSRFDRPQVGLVVASLGAWALAGYVCFVFVYGEAVLGVYVGAGLTVLALAVGALLWLAGLTRLLRRRPWAAGAAANLGLTCGTAAAALAFADLSYGVYVNAQVSRQSDTMRALDFSERLFDERVWLGELNPPTYFPTDRNFQLYKPNFSSRGEAYGGLYHPEMLDSELIADSVLEMSSVSYEIGPVGLRETDSLAESSVFAIGDSFVFGHGTGEGETWTDRLSQALDEPVYNLGVSNTGPRQHYLLLEHLLETHADSMEVDHLLWMIFEGNDLEDGYGEERPTLPQRSAARELIGGTILAGLLSLPGELKNSSIIRRALTGELGQAPAGGGVRYEAYEVDGVRIPFPVYTSERFGPRIFNFQGLDRGSLPLEYVLNHGNRPRLEETFLDMAELGRAHGFRITLIIAPTAARLYGPSMEGFPTMSPEPHFINFIADLGRRNDFPVLNLLAEMRPYAEQELLYFRDDLHWNPRGNSVAAVLIARAIEPR